MNKEQIQERLTKLQTERAQTQATLLAYEGAIQDCNYWLTQIDAPAATETPAEDTSTVSS